MMQKSILACIVLTILGMPTVHAATIKWIKASGDWTTPDNWDLKRLPNVSDYVYIANGGAVEVTAADESCSSLSLGTSSGSGALNMTSGSLSSGYQYVGDSGKGKFTLSSGTNTISTYLYLGYGSTGDGTYELSGTGILNAPREYIGVSGTGTFKQTGGTHTVTSNYFHIALMYTSIGTYELSGGQLISNFETVGSGGVGTFTHSGGSNTISGDFIVGDGSTSNGTYELKGTGYLSSFSEIIGRSGMGKLTHSSGTNTMARLYLGFEALGNGTYELSDEGNMICPFQLVGYLGTGTFTQSGGTNTCTNLLCLGNQSTSSGTYNLNGGTLVLNAFFPGSGAAFFNFGGGTLQACNGFTYSPQMTLTGTGGDANVDTAGYTVTFSSPLIGLGGLNKKGTGTLTLSATNTYSGTTTISMGTLALSGTGTLANSNVIDVASGSMFLVSAVNDGFSLGTGQTLKGSGTIIGNLTVKGVHAPGDSPGIETVQGNYNLQGQLQIELMGTMAGNGYDQVLLGVNGSSKFNATLGGLLTLDWTGMNGSTDASKLWILENDTAGTLSGEFSNYANGASLGLHDGREWQIWYGADATTGNLTGGNDVLIAPVPEPAAIILLALAAFGLFGWMRKRQA